MQLLEKGIPSSSEYTSLQQRPLQLLLKRPSFGLQKLLQDSSFRELKVLLSKFVLVAFPPFFPFLLGWLGKSLSAATRVYQSCLTVLVSCIRIGNAFEWSWGQPKLRTEPGPQHQDYASPKAFWLFWAGHLDADAKPPAPRTLLFISHLVHFASFASI